MVVAIAKLGDVLMQMAQGDLVVLADDTALQQPPESFNRVRVDFAIYVGNLMVDDRVKHKAVNSTVAAELVSDEDSIRDFDVLADELRQTLEIELRFVYGASNDFSATFNHSDYGNFRGSASTLVCACSFARLSADVGLVHLHDAFEQLALLEHRIANPHSHVPSGILVDFQIAGQLSSRKSFLRVQNERDRQEPFLQRQMSVMEDCVKDLERRSFLNLNGDDVGVVGRFFHKFVNGLPGWRQRGIRGNGWFFWLRKERSRAGDPEEH